MLNAAIHPIEKTQPAASPVVSPFKTIALIGRNDASGLAAPLATMGDYLRKQGRQVLVEKDTALSSRIVGFPVADYAEIAARADLAVVQGGDGSMLGAARNLAPHRVPLVGVNQGRLGFMADIASTTMLEAMADILAGRYATEDRSMLAVEVRRDGRTEFSTLVLNDVVINKGAVLRLIDILVSIGGESMVHLRADGLIIATPTGSTAYSLSSDGPILQPGVPAFALVPICPHTLSNRPIVVSDRSAIEVTLRRAVDARLHLDGQLERKLLEGDRLAISRAAHTATFVHPPGYNYYGMLRGKLHWGEVL